LRSKHLDYRKKDHGETCQCRRCRAREKALDRRPMKAKVSEYAKYYSRLEQYDDED